MDNSTFERIFETLIEYVELKDSEKHRVYNAEITGDISAIITIHRYANGNDDPFKCEVDIITDTGIITDIRIELSKTEVQISFYGSTNGIEEWHRIKISTERIERINEAFEEFSDEGSIKWCFDLLEELYGNCLDEIAESKESFKDINAFIDKIKDEMIVFKGVDDGVMLCIGDLGDGIKEEVVFIPDDDYYTCLDKVIGLSVFIRYKDCIIYFENHDTYYKYNRHARGF